MDNESNKLFLAGFSAEDYDELVKYVNKKRHPLSKAILYFMSMNRYRKVLPKSEITTKENFGLPIGSL